MCGREGWTVTEDTGLVTATSSNGETKRTVFAEDSSSSSGIK